MGKIVLLAVAAAWAAVLLPPLLRSRLENRPGSSVTDFRRQLSTLQRAVPTRSMTPMRSMGRPLAPSPLQRPAASGRPGVPSTSGMSNLSGTVGQFQRAHASERAIDRSYDRTSDRTSDRSHDRSHGALGSERIDVGYTGELQRRYDRDGAGRQASGQAARHATHATQRFAQHGSPRLSQREAVRRRRANVLFVLVALTGATLFLAATTKSSAMVYAFALAFVSLCGYCYKLAQLRQYEHDRTGADAHWYHAA